MKPEFLHQTKIILSFKGRFILKQRSICFTIFVWTNENVF